MSIRDIVVDACPKSDTQQTLERALEIATAFDAKLVVAAYAWPVRTASDVLAGTSMVASRRSVFTRSPGFIGISDGATTSHRWPRLVSCR